MTDSKANSLLNPNRPPAFCPGCAHDVVTRALDRALADLSLAGHQVAIVSDIGCSGLFDTFFNTHAFHGLHGRALTYATGLKLARPDLTVIVTMGDGGLGIGGAHVLSTCRRNIDMTLLVLNNFNYGMTGGQCSPTTPVEAKVASGFLNRLEKPLDICRVAAAAGASHASRVSAYDKALSEAIRRSIEHKGFSLMDIWGVCPGRYTRRNPLTPKSIAESLAALPAADGPVPENQRPEYGAYYRELAAAAPPAEPPAGISVVGQAPERGRREVVILGGAGQRIVTAGEILALAAMAGGLEATQKNDYPITVLRGHSVAEVVVSDAAIDYTGITSPDVIIALSDEGVARKRDLFVGKGGAQGGKTGGGKTPLILRAADVALPEGAPEAVAIDFKAMGVRPPDRALASLAALARMERIITPPLLEAALRYRFDPPALDAALKVVAAENA